jgi:truncated hemoglobin YjbI/tellurite resistance-related uncharacterized protein
MNGVEGIEEAGLRRLIERFYARVRVDELLGPLFNDAVHDWPDHLQKLADFWSSVMLTSGRYKGTPLAAHLKHKDRITPAMFERWLALWRETTDAHMSPEAAAALQAKAARIAQSLQLAVLPPVRRTPVPSVPYRSTAAFDEITLPAALRVEHRLKSGVWGVIEVIEGALKFSAGGQADGIVLTAPCSRLILPDQAHRVEPIGAMRMRVHFYDHLPRATARGVQEFGAIGLQPVGQGLA